MMHRCIISLASNQHQKENLAEARRRLSQILQSADYTEELWTEPEGSSCRPGSPLYLNQLVYAFTALSVDELQAALKDLERSMGRTDDDRRAGVVRIDLDLMQCDDVRYHLRDWNRRYIQDLLR